MNPERALGLFMNPLLLWSQVAWTAGGLAIDATRASGHRARGLALVRPGPSVRDQREVALESVQAIGAKMLKLNEKFTVLAFEQMLSTSVALMSVAGSRNAAESVNRLSTPSSDEPFGENVIRFSRPGR